MDEKYSKYSDRHDTTNKNLEPNNYYRDTSFDDRTALDSGIGSRRDSSLDSRRTGNHSVDHRKDNSPGTDRHIDDGSSYHYRSDMRGADNRKIDSRDYEGGKWRFG